MNEQLNTRMQELYAGLEPQIRDLEPDCNACGVCCDFERYGHRLYISTPELRYFVNHIGPDIRSMEGEICPYNENGKCMVYPYRFLACRIFCCNTLPTGQSEIYEQAIIQLKMLCRECNIQYRYMDLKNALQMPILMEMLDPVQ